MPAVENSILDETKKLLGIDADYTIFDTDVKIHINSVFSTLHQLGVGPTTPFSITSNSETWNTFFGDAININDVKTYVYLRVRLLFDPPGTSFAISAIESQLRELEWRLNIVAEGVENAST